jgi:hypothetical protein
MKIFIINFLGIDYEEIAGNMKIIDHCKIRLETSILFAVIFLSVMSIGYTDSSLGILYRERQLAICVILMVLLIIVRTFKTIKLINKLVATREVITAGKINGLYVIDLDKVSLLKDVGSKKVYWSYLNNNILIRDEK